MKNENNRRWTKRAPGLWLGLFIFWLLLSGQTQPLLVGLGALSSGLVVLLALRMNLVDSEGFPIQLGMRALLYGLWLGVKIIRANLAILRLICLSCFRPPSKVISPVFGSVVCSQASQFGQATYANSITLTPGTVALGLHRGRIKVHSITPQAFQELELGNMDQRVTWVEGIRSC